MDEISSCGATLGACVCFTPFVIIGEKKVTLWHCDDIDDSKEPVPLEWAKAVIEEMEVVEFEITTSDDFYDLWLSEEKLRLMDL